MPRVSEAVDDTTPLTASRIDVPARIGWLLRSSRTVAGLSLRQMSAALREHDIHLSSTTLARIESDGQPSGAALEGYTKVLGMAGGRLRTPVDALLSTFSYYTGVMVERPSLSLEDFSEACEAVLDGTPDGSDWLRFVHAHGPRARFGLPRALMAEQVARMVGEVGRSVGFAFNARFHALAALRCTAYRDVCLEVVRERVLVPENQAVEAALGSVAELPEPALVVWFGELLDHRSVALARGASYALQNMLVVGGLERVDWMPFVDLYSAAWRHGAADPARRAILLPLHAALPQDLAALVTAACHVRPSPASGSRSWARSRQNPHYEFARELARETCERLGHHEEPLLARLLFEAMFDPRGVRMATSTVLLACSTFASTLVEVLIERHDRGPGPESEPAALRVAMVCYDGGALPTVSHLLASPSTASFEVALAFYGRSGTPLPETGLVRGLAGDETTVRRTLYALGMASDARLEALATSTGSSTDVRVAARWWLQHGGRIVR